MSNLRKYRYVGAALIVAVVISAAWGANETDSETQEPLGIGDAADGSRSNPVHKISLHDDKGFVVFPQVNSTEPFSSIQTCGRCHNYDLITSGWHFSDVDQTVEPGRRGEPWIYWDCATASQIPLSYRNWSGAFRPEELGLTRWWFTRIFGRHMPGGGPGAKDAASDANSVDRWSVSGELEINCLGCHDGESSHDQAEYARQISNENFRWAATAACGFASVQGAAKNLPDFWEPSDESGDVPTVTYDAGRFLPGRRVFLDIVGKAANERCYYCHSSRIVGAGHGQDDVHLAAGLGCVDCHRNGPGHFITRGYEDEAEQTGNPMAVGVSCRGCHLGVKGSSKPTGGGLGAPVPKHVGIPAVHFEKLSCTACHSGPWPGRQTFTVKTSRAHALGTHGVNKNPAALPHIQAPVFAKQEDGRIGPHKLLWPAFWGQLGGESVTPIHPKVVKEAAGKILYLDVELASASWPEMSEATVAEVLTALASKAAVEGEPVYVCGGKLYQLVDGKIAASEHDAGEPYMWPLGHDVRPAAQALGTGGCGDCHSTDKPFIFGKVAVDSPLASDKKAPMKMIDFQDADPVYARLFAMSFVFRPWFKIISIAACLVLGAVVLLYGFRLLACILPVLAAKACGAAPPQYELTEARQNTLNRLLPLLKLVRNLAYFVGVVSFVVLVVSGFYPLATGARLSGYWVMAHATAAPVFAACLAVLALFWADRHSFCKLIAPKPENQEATSSDFCLCQKILFWLIVLSALPLIMAIVMMMFPLFAAHTQECLLQVHRGAALVSAIAVILLIAISLGHKVKPAKKNK